DLPEETMKQRKQGFSVPVAKWMQDKLGDELLARFSKSDPLLNAETVRKMVQLHKSNKANFGHLLWRLYVWSVWSESCR
ncbi:MAG: asparagine synthase-related protein, partial [Candidatus Fervidibacter sp.]